MKKLLIIVALLLIFPACAQKLPSYEDGYGMVAIPFHLINRSGIKFLHTYEWVSSQDEAFSVKIQEGTYNNDVALSKLLPSGNYKIDTLIIREVMDAGVISNFKEIKREIEPPFEIYISSGSIMMVPFVYEFEQYLEKDAIMSKPNIHEIEDTEKEFYIDRLKKRENFDGWKIEIL